MWRSELSALSRRILGLLEAAKFHASYMGSRFDTGSAVSQLMPVTAAIFQDLQALQYRYARTLPAGAATALAAFLETSAATFRAKPDPALRDDCNRYLYARVTILTALEAEISYHLTDFQERAKRLSKRAFTHLQRSIVADPECAKRWQNAFTKGEIACEKLGAAHLLWHGIWAFKASSERERTDLIMGDTLHDRRGDIEEVAEALVLTEWKKVNDVSELPAAQDAAYRQAKIYASGSLAGLELDTYRYLVLVIREEQLSLRDDFKEEGVWYCHINIAVDPRSPSRAARKR